MSEVRRLLDDTVERLFAGAVTPERIVAAERGVWHADLWRAVEAHGLATAHLGEAAGGAGATWREACIVARASGRHAAPLPLAETMLAAWLLERAGLPVPPGPLTVAPTPVTPPGRASSARLERVPWGRHAGHVVVTWPEAGGLGIGIVAAPAPVAEACNLAREPRDDLEVAAPPLAAGRASLPADTVTSYGALLRAAQMAGALETVLDLSVRYATERVQFGRPIGQFQAIQQDLARLAGMVAAAGVAAEVAGRAAADAAAGGDPTPEIAAAKVVVGDAAEHAPRIAHQVHGAIGFTYEHRLQFFTRRLWSWRAEFGTTETWAERLGASVLAGGAAALWPAITAR
jgi:acyl-CoA dehydrogenase